MYLRLLGLILVGVFVTCPFAFAEMSSTSYQIDWDSLNYGGSDSSSSTSYILRDTVGNAGAGTSSSTSYSDQAGYRAGIFDQYISFKLFSQSGSSVQTASGLAGNTVTTTTTGFLVNDYIVLIQDLGASQIAAIGKIESIGAGLLTVDSWTNDGAAPVIDGSNDYVYKLSGTSSDFGTLSTNEVKTTVTGFEVTIDSDAGYTVQIMEDGELRSGANTITDVADGTVTAGVKEYGARSSDTTLATSAFDTEDAAITSSFQDIANESTFQFVSRNFLTLKAAIDSGTSAGTYGQVLTFIASGNF